MKTRQIVVGASIAFLGATALACAHRESRKSAPAPPEARPAEATGAANAAPAAAPAAPAALSRGPNLLRNHDFETEAEVWKHMGGQNWGAFSIVDGGRNASRAALLQVLAPPGDRQPANKVFGVVQEIRGDELPGEFPETIGGHYRVRRWSKEDPATFLYIQVVVIIWKDPAAHELIGSDVTNHQIRFLLAGTSTPPFRISNARFSFEGTEPPPLDAWVRFEIPVRKRFQELWGKTPSGFEFIRVLYEARWDGKAEGKAVDAEVLFDDLFFGYGAMPGAP